MVAPRASVIDDLAIDALVIGNRIIRRLAMNSIFVVATKDLPRAKVGGVDDPSVRWAGAFASYGDTGPPNLRQSSMKSSQADGWAGIRTRPRDAIYHCRHRRIALEDGKVQQVKPGDVFVIPTPIRHDLANTGTETLRAVAFFAAPMFTQHFDNAMLAPDVHVLGTPNRDV